MVSFRWTRRGTACCLHDRLSSAAAAAIRELLEETGLSGVILRQLVHAPDAIFLVDVDDAAEPVVRDDQELFSLAWRPLADVKDDSQVRLVLAAL